MIILLHIHAHTHTHRRTHKHMFFFAFLVKCPAPLRNRDFVAQRCWKKNSNDEYIVFNHSVAHEVS